MFRFLCLSTALLTLICTGVAGAQDRDEFVEIFDGKTLDGWVGDPTYWSVRDGAITGVTDGTLSMNRFLIRQGDPVANFEWLAEVRVTAGGNSGLQYRSRPRPEIGDDILSGYQCDVVADNPQYNGMLYEERGRRILSHTGEKVVVDPRGQPWIVGHFEVKTFQPDQWHQYRVLARGNHLRHWIDDHPTADLIDLDPAGRSLSGSLGVQVHVGPAMTIQYRNVRLRRLPDDLPLLTEQDVNIPAGSRGVRPQAKLPVDWKPPVHP